MEALGLAANILAVTASISKFFAIFGFNRNAGKNSILVVANAVERDIKILQDTLAVLLEGIIPPGEIEKLLLDPANQTWQTPEIDEALKERMGDVTYDMFLDHLRSLHEAVVPLDRSLRSIVENPDAKSLLSVRALKWAFLKNKTQQALENLHRRTGDLNNVARLSLHAHDPLRSRQAIQNISDVLDQIHDAQRVAQNVEAIANGEVIVPADGNDTLSTYTVETEVSIGVQKGVHPSHHADTSTTG